MAVRNIYQQSSLFIWRNSVSFSSDNDDSLEWFCCCFNTSLTTGYLLWDLITHAHIHKNIYKAHASFHKKTYNVLLSNWHYTDIRACMQSEEHFMSSHANLLSFFDKLQVHFTMTISFISSTPQAKSYVILQKKCCS